MCLVAELFSELLCARFGQTLLRALPLIAKESSEKKVRGGAVREGAFFAIQSEMHLKLVFCSFCIV